MTVIPIPIPITFIVLLDVVDDRNAAVRCAADALADCGYVATRADDREDSGPQNYSFWHNEEFDKVVAGKRMALIRRAEDLMEQDPPLVPVAWENILDAWYNYVKGHNPKDYFGIYDVVRFDTFWLDKA